MATKKKPKGITVYVVLYGHRHGEDVWVCSTEKKAEASVGAAITDSVEELRDAKVKNKVKRLIAKGAYMTASNIWFEAKEEWFEIHCRTVDT